jgi:hypothetical protein
LGFSVQLINLDTGNLIEDVLQLDLLLLDILPNSTCLL